MPSGDDDAVHREPQLAAAEVERQRLGARRARCPSATTGRASTIVAQPGIASTAGRSTTSTSAQPRRGRRSAVPGADDPVAVDEEDAVADRREHARGLCALLGLRGRAARCRSRSRRAGRGRRANSRSPASYGSGRLRPRPRHAPRSCGRAQPAARRAPNARPLSARTAARDRQLGAGSVADRTLRAASARLAARARAPASRPPLAGSRARRLTRRAVASSPARWIAHRSANSSTTSAPSRSSVRRRRGRAEERARLGEEPEPVAAALGLAVEVRVVDRDCRARGELADGLDITGRRSCSVVRISASTPRMRSRALSGM